MSPRAVESAIQAAWSLLFNGVECTSLAGSNLHCRTPNVLLKSSNGKVLLELTQSRVLPTSPARSQPKILDVMKCSTLLSGVVYLEWSFMLMP